MGGLGAGLGHRMKYKYALYILCQYGTYWFHQFVILWLPFVGTLQASPSFPLRFYHSALLRDNFFSLFLHVIYMRLVVRIFYIHERHNYVGLVYIFSLPLVLFENLCK